jgi:hypothetical protein
MARRHASEPWRVSREATPLLEGRNRLGTQRDRGRSRLRPFFAESQGRRFESFTAHQPPGCGARIRMVARATAAILAIFARARGPRAVLGISPDLATAGRASGPNARRCHKPGLGQRVRPGR